MKYFRYALKRLFTCALVIFLGACVMYFIPAIKGDKTYEVSLRGLAAYFGDCLRMDFGISKYYKTDIAPLIWRYMPYTMGLCLLTALISWLIGNAAGLIAGTSRRAGAKLIEALGVAVYPMPYYILALLVQIIFAYHLGLFPLTSEIMKGHGLAEFISTYLRSTFLPALTMIIAGCGWWLISMKALSQNEAGEDYANFARYMNLPPRVVREKYVRRNCMVSQYSGLAVQLGSAFGGAIITEAVFSYPGVGFLIKRAAFTNDYNLLFAAALISIITVAISTFALDLLMPLIDPRVRLK